MIALPFVTDHTTQVQVGKESLTCPLHVHVPYMCSKMGCDTHPLPACSAASCAKELFRQRNRG
jgi:hypothetical protein